MCFFSLVGILRLYGFVLNMYFFNLDVCARVWLSVRLYVSKCIRCFTCNLYRIHS